MLSDAAMKRPLILALTAALLAAPAAADTLITNANGIQVDAAGRVRHFRGLLIGDDGKIVAWLQPHAIAALEKCEKGWCRLKASGVKGWVRQEDVWGGGPPPVCKARRD